MLGLVDQFQEHLFFFSSLQLTSPALRFFQQIEILSTKFRILFLCLFFLKKKNTELNSHGCHLFGLQTANCKTSYCLTSHHSHKTKSADRVAKPVEESVRVQLLAKTTILNLLIEYVITGVVRS